MSALFSATPIASPSSRSTYSSPSHGRPAPAVRQGTALVHAYMVSATAQALAHPSENLFVIGVPNPTSFELHLPAELGASHSMRLRISPQPKPQDAPPGSC